MSVEILYFLTGSVMCHPDVVNIAKNDIEINHILSKTWKYILYRLHRAVFFISSPDKKKTRASWNTRGTRSLVSNLREGEKRRGRRIKAAGQSP